MKLATLKSPSRDGTLVVVSKDLSRAVEVPEIAPTLQAALDHWHDAAPQLETVYKKMNSNASEGFAFDPTKAAAPLPRAYQWADGSAYVNHVELVRKARGAEMPKNFWTDPLMYQGGSDAFIGAHDPIEIADEDWGIDFEAEIGVITDDVPMGTPAEKAGQHIQLFVLINDVSLRNLIPNEISKGFGFFHSKPASSFSPVAVTPDELGDAWNGEKLSLPLVSSINGEIFGQPEAGDDMTFSFPQLIAHAAKTRHLSSGSIIGSGTVANEDRSRGASCIAEKRMVETLKFGEPRTPFFQFGDRIRIEMKKKTGEDIFGAIDQTIHKYELR